MLGWGRHPPEREDSMTFHDTRRLSVVLFGRES